MNNLVEVAGGHAIGPPMSPEAQIAKLAELGADVICAQEVTGRYLDLCTRLLGPESASRQIRFLRHPDLNTSQRLAVFSRWPINQERSTNLGPFFAEGVVEPLLTHERLGPRELEAAVLAAEIGHPEGDFWAVTAHLAWTEKAHEGLKPHQIEAIRRLAAFMEELHKTGLPIVLGADLNALLVDCEQYMPSWVDCLVSEKLRAQVGTTIDTPDEGKARRLAENKVYIDGIFASRLFELVGDIQVVSGLSDHKGHFATLRIV